MELLLVLKLFKITANLRNYVLIIVTKMEPALTDNAYALERQPCLHLVLMFQFFKPQSAQLVVSWLLSQIKVKPSKILMIRTPILLKFNFSVILSNSILSIQSVFREQHSILFSDNASNVRISIIVNPAMIMDVLAVTMEDLLAMAAADSFK